MSQDFEAKKLVPPLPNTSDTTVLGNGASLVAALLQDDAFAGYRRETPDADFISLSDQDTTVILLTPAIWNSPLRFKPFLENIHKPQLCMVAVGNEAELHQISPEHDDKALHRMALPLSLGQLKLHIQNFFRMQNLLANRESSQKEILETAESVKYVLRVSRELNGVRDTNKLLSLILRKAREITDADAGSIYVVERNLEKPNEGFIHFKVTQNESVPQNLSEFTIPLSGNSIVGNAVIHQTTINIPDLYLLNPDPSKNPYNARHDRTWDVRIGYQCRSMLTLPMFDISHQVIGVIQLINRKKKGVKTLSQPQDFEHHVLAFDDTAIEFAEIIAQQAGIALENALLTQEKEQLFEGFVHASVTAIEQRDPTTSGHSHRVAKLTVGLAEVVNIAPDGDFKNLKFTDQQLKELEYASLLHDFGKLGVREQVLVKAKKLYPWQLELILERFDHIRSRFEVEYLKDLVQYLQTPDTFPPGFGADNFQRIKEEKIRELDDFLTFVLKSNEPTVLEQGGFERLKDIANLTYTNSRQQKRSFLVDDELKALSVSRGSLTREEFAEIQSHVTHTYEFLRKIPWGRDFGNLPQIAAKHHEKLDGSGYPMSAGADEIPVQTRIMTIADIFDALTAADRPYKKAVPTLKALDIIETEVKAGKCDKELFRLFVESKIYASVLEPDAL